MKKSRPFLAALLLLLAAGESLAQQALLSDPEIYEKKHFQEKCRVVQFDNAFTIRQDINNDGIVDAVVNHGAVACDGQRGPGCDGDGCIYNFYLQVKEGGYFMMATARIYGYDFQQRFGNMVLAMKMHPRFCERPEGTEPCVITTRVRGAKFYTISKK